MTTLGSGIGPSPAMMRDQMLNDAIDAMIRERGDTVAVIREILDRMNELLAAQARVAEAQLQAVQVLQSFVRQAPPTVNVDVSPTPVSIEAAQVPPAQVEVLTAPEPRTKKTVHRDRDGLIDYIIEEPA